MTILLVSLVVTYFTTNIITIPVVWYAYCKDNYTTRVSFPIVLLVWVFGGTAYLAKSFIAIIRRNH